jgi:hypothetical protein
MKKALLIVPLVATLVGCAGMKEIPDRKTYAQPVSYTHLDAADDQSTV